MTKKIVILYSGGLDSFIMKKLAENKNPNSVITLVHFDIGQEYSTKERQAIEKSGFNVEIRKVDWLSKQSDLYGKSNNSGNIYIPGRNMVLASLAASIYMPDEVWMGGLKGEDHATATDKNRIFIDTTNALWQYVYSPFDTVPLLIFPLIEENWGKFEAVQWVHNNNLATKDELLATSSCLKGEEGNCGHCIVCARRKYIFKQLGIEEIYNQDPLTGIDNLKMIIEMLCTPLDADDNTVHYDSWRRREILPGLYIEFNTSCHKTLIRILQDKLDNINKGIDHVVCN